MISFIEYCYPKKISYDEFLKQFGSIITSDDSLSEKKNCKILLEFVKIDETEYKFGHENIYLKNHVIDLLRNSVLNRNNEMREDLLNKSSKNYKR